MNTYTFYIDEQVNGKYINKDLFKIATTNILKQYEIEYSDIKITSPTSEFDFNKSPTIQKLLLNDATKIKVIINGLSQAHLILLKLIFQ